MVDNASHDGTPAMVAERFPSVRLIANDENVGYGGALQPGDRGGAAGGTCWCSTRTSPCGRARCGALVDFAEAHPLAGAVGARLEYEDGRFQHSAFRFPDWKQAFFGFFDGLVPLDSEINGRYPPDQLDRPFVAEHLLGACLLLRREALEQVGAFDPTFFMYYEETDLCVRLTTAGWQQLLPARPRG